MSAEAITWIIWSYFVGSLPFGYWITKLVSQKNLLSIGYKKNSGSNVIKYVGTWQGVLTIFLDVVKGFLVVFLAQQLGLAGWIQVAAAIAVVIGHNWSPFLLFAGGRGVAALMGAFLAFSFPITAAALIIFAVIFVIWDASIGTLLVFPTVILLSYTEGKLEYIGIFALLVLFPILLKRVSPFNDISNINLFIRRLVRDGDTAIFEFRVMHLFEHYLKPIILLIQRMKDEISPVLFLSPKDVTEFLSAAAQKSIVHQQEVNEINVFPVADKDTGYNLSATTIGIENAIATKEYKTFSSLARDVRLSAVKSARGNAGMIYVGFLLGLFERFEEEKKEISADVFAQALQRSVVQARSAIYNPVEGTMLDVISATANGAEEYVKAGNNIIELLEHSHKQAKIALKETTEKLEVLKKNNVVDAGALGFVRILESWIENLKGEVPAVSIMAPINLMEEQPPPKYRYCVQIGFQNTRGDIKQLKEELSALGNSIEVLEAEGRIRLHIHTDSPEAVQAKLLFAEDINVHIEDMRAQVAGTVVKSLGLIVGDTASLPSRFIEKNNITEIPFTAQFPNGEKVTKENAYKKMREALLNKTFLLTTSQPALSILQSSFTEAFNKYKEVVVLTLSSELSGTYGSLRVARSMLSNKQSLTIFDTGIIDAGEALVVYRAQELINQGKDSKELINLLSSYVLKVKLVGIPEDIRYILRSGRINPPKALIPILLLTQKLGFRIVLAMKGNRLKLDGVIWGGNVPDLIIKEFTKRKTSKRTKVVLTHADNEEGLEELREKIKKIDDTEILHTALVSTVVGVYIGPGSLIVGFVEA